MDSYVSVQTSILVFRSRCDFEIKLGLCVDERCSVNSTIKKKKFSSFNYQTNWSKMNLKYMYTTFVVSELCPLIIRKMTSLIVSK